MRLIGGKPAGLLVALAVVLCCGGLILWAALTHPQGSPKEAPTAAASTSSPAPTSKTAHASPDPLQSLLAGGVPDSSKYATSDGDGEETPYVDPDDCSLHLTKASYAALTKRIWAYYAKVYPDGSVESEEWAKQFGTKAFITFNTAPTPTPAPTNSVMRTVAKFSSLSCTMFGSTPEVVFKPALVPVSDPNDNDANSAPSETSDWVRQGKTWRIEKLVANY